MLHRNLHLQVAFLDLEGKNDQEKLQGDKPAPTPGRPRDRSAEQALAALKRNMLLSKVEMVAFTAYCTPWR
jgi:hypothetical protein